MKVVILAGGLPSIIGEENDKVPKPMVQVGERPLLWHIMKLFSHYGYNDFIICTGYKSDMIKDYFLNYYVYGSDITVHLKTNKVDVHNHVTEPWQVSIVDTGLTATTAERLYRIRGMLDGDFIVAYGDCVTDIEIPALVESHRKSNKKMTAVLAKPTGRNRLVPLDGSGQITVGGNAGDVPVDAWANACMMVAASDVVCGRPAPDERFEIETVRRMAAQSQVNVFRHGGFWMPVETVRDRDWMQGIWNSGHIPWKKWDD